MVCKIDCYLQTSIRLVISQVTLVVACAFSRKRRRAPDADGNCKCNGYSVATFCKCVNNVSRKREGKQFLRSYKSSFVLFLLLLQGTRPRVKSNIIIRRNVI